MLGSLLGWLLIAPIAALVPKRRDWMAVIGKQDGMFLDNAKFFFLQATMSEPNLRIVWVTERDDTAVLRCHGCEVLKYPGLASIWFLLRCAVAVVDEAAWFRRGRIFLLKRAAVVQLWHGVGFKRIELDQWRNEARRVCWMSHPLVLRLRLLVYRVTGRRMRYAAVATTSPFYRDQVFKPAFLAQRFPITGYPRNDFGRCLRDAFGELAWSNVDADVKQQLEVWKRLGRKLVLVAPTFRDSGSVPMHLADQALCAIDAFAEEHGIEFIFKFHPFERHTDRITGRHFHVCARDSDIYPLFPHTDALVTDYSSISMDFLLVDKPLLFLIPDGENYMQNDRQLQFDPRTMMPGPVVPEWSALLAALLAEWTHDSYAGERAILRRKAFDDLPQAGAVPILLALMREQGWISGVPSPDKH